MLRYSDIAFDSKTARSGEIEMPVKEGGCPLRRIERLLAANHGHGENKDLQENE